MNLDNQCDIFSILHDGDIEEVIYIDNGIRIKMSIMYLAELIEEDFEYIYLDLIECDRFDFLVYETDSYETDFDLISGFDATFLQCKKTDNDFLKIVCAVKEGAGGELLVRTKEIMVYDEMMNEISLENLAELCDKYWKA